MGVEGKLGICSKMIKNYKSIELSKDWWRRTKHREAEKSTAASVAIAKVSVGSWRQPQTGWGMLGLPGCVPNPDLCWACLLVTEEDGLICLTWSLGEITLDCVILDELADFFLSGRETGFTGKH